MIALVVLLLLAVLAAGLGIYYYARRSRKEAFTSSHVLMREESGFLSPEHCDRIRDIAARQGFLPSRVVMDGKAAGSLDSSVRISEQAWLKPEEHAAVMDLYRKVEALTGIPMRRYEDLQVVRYGPGGHYKEHYDDCRDDEPCGDFWTLGGRRVFTVLVYLNGRDEVWEGGETEFPRLDLKVAPEKGKMIWFRNVRPNGTLEPDSLHAARPLVRGTEKVACQLWIRQGDRPERV